jgi:glycosyltransferase involved in cell wall biosynthesis
LASSWKQHEWKAGSLVKVYVFPADQQGCGYYRLIWPAQELARQGHDVVVVDPKDRDRSLAAQMDGGHVVSVRIPDDADVIVFQRVTHRFLAEAIPLIRSSGRAVVVDMDDDLTCIHPANPAFHKIHPTGPNALHSWQNTLTACDAATLVTTSTDALVDRYARRASGFVLRNAVPARYLRVEHEDSDVVGWAGSVHSHPTDLQVMGSAVAQLLQVGHAFKLVGPTSGVHTALGISQRFELESTGIIKDLMEWPSGVSTLGIGVAPLAESKFNAAKSWLKPLEYAAVGVPCVVSPRVEYTRLARLGVGWVARDPREWRKKLQILIKSRAMRLELSDRGRKVAEEHTIEGNAWRWLEAWTRAFELERSGALTRSGTA